LDRPVLHAFVSELVEYEKLVEFANDLPQRARVSEAALPVVLASLHERLERPLVCLVPEDVDARDAADAVSWFLGDEVVGTLPSRGVSWESGLEPPPHLVGERARALHVLERGGLVVASARGLAEELPPPDARPQAIELRAGAETGVDGLAEELALAGYARVERVDDRGQFAVRGGLIDVFPTTGREPLRIEFFGDEVESIRAFSPFTQRALHPVDECTIFPAAERRIDLLDPEQEGVPDDLVPVLDRAPDFVFQPDDVRRVWEEDDADELDLTRASELDPFPQSQPYAFEAQRPAIASRGISEAETELAQLVRAGQRVVVAFPHRRCSSPARPCPPSRPSSSQSRRRAAASSGATSASFSCPTIRCSAGACRASGGSAAAHCRALPTCGRATTSCTRTTASRSCSASRRRPSRA
jgi:transcription-repair coupling factor (superfamily II helicase)